MPTIVMDEGTLQEHSALWDFKRRRVAARQCFGAEVLDYKKAPRGQPPVDSCFPTSPSRPTPHGSSQSHLGRSTSDHHDHPHTCSCLAIILAGGPTTASSSTVGTQFSCLGGKEAK